ncbi:hypothetical protein VDGL01_03169 [Verticillium dahliae]|nr:hypothetical protein VdG2_02458 [Verticillium dahliae VDG2]
MVNGVLFGPQHHETTLHETRQLSFGTAVNSSVQLAQDALISLHSTIGLPWWLAIPAFALGFTLTLRLPLQIYSRKIILGQRKLLPFTSSWRARHLNVHKGPYVAIQQGKTLRRIYRERGVQSWKIWVTLFSIPPWLLVPEAIRRLSGASGGILSLITGNYKNGHPELATAPAQQAVIAAPGESDNFTAEPVLGSLGDAPSTGVLESLQTAATQIEPSMTTGGILWFPDLSAPDPYGLLPMAMAGLLCYTWIPKTAAGRAAMFNLSNKLSSSLETSGWRWRLRRTAFVASLLLPMAAMNLPSGMFVYWVSSATFGHINAALVERYMPLDKHQAPARRKDVPRKA